MYSATTSKRRAGDCVAFDMSRRVYSSVRWDTASQVIVSHDR